MAVSIACRAAAPNPSRAGAAYGRSEPWQTPSIPSTRIDGVDGEQAVGRRLDEGERVDGAAVAAAGALALAVERAEAGERDEADAQPRMPRAALRRPRPPGGVQLGDVGHDRRPPGGAAGRVGGAGGAGVDEQRAVAVLQDREQRGDAVEAAGGGEDVGGELEPDRAAVERVAERRGVGLDGAGAGPGAERGGEARARPRARRRTSVCRLRRRQPVEPERGGRRDERPRSASPSSRSTGSWCAGSIAYGRSPGRCSVQPSSRGGTFARAQGVEERLGPEVLVEVDARSCVTEPVH